MKRLMIVMVLIGLFYQTAISEGEKGKQEAKSVKIDWRGVSVMAITQQVQAATGKQFLWPEATALTPRIYFLSDKEFTPDDLFNLYQSILQVTGFCLVKVGKEGEEIYKIMPVASGVKNPVEVKEEVKLPTDELICRVFPLKYAPPERVVPILTNLISAPLGAFAITETGVIVVHDYEYNIKKIEEIIKLIDVKKPDVIIKTFRLKYAVATEIDPVLKSLITTLQQAGVGRTPGMPPMGFQQVEPLNITADRRTNSIIVLALPDRMKQIEELIEKLDTEAVTQAIGVYAYRIKHHPSAAELAKILNETLVAFAQQQLGPGAAPGAPPGAVPPGWIKPSISADEKTNSLIIVADRNTYKMIEDLLLVLDRRTPQVFILATIIEITANDTFDIGAELSRYIDPKGRTTVVGTSRFNLIALQPDNDGDGIPEMIPVDTPGLTLAVLKETADRIPFIIKALRDKASVGILSEPELLVNDNQEGQINIAESRPIPTFTQQIGVPTQASYRYEDAGITLKIKPNISAEGQYLRLTVTIEVSGFGTQPDPTIPPPKDRRTVETSIIIESGRTIVIGGLSSSSDSKTQRETPFLGDIPVLGEIFKFRRTIGTKRTLYVFITPYIIADDSLTGLINISLQKKKVVEERTGKSLDYLPFMGYRRIYAPTLFRFSSPQGLPQVEK